MNSSIQKTNFHPCIISLDKLNIKQIKFKRTNSKNKGIELNLHNKKIIHQRSKSKECSSINKELKNDGKGKKLIINKAELFHNIKKKTILNNNIRPLQSKGLSRSNSISNIEQISSSDASTATSKRIPKKSNCSKNNTNYIQHYIPKINNETKRYLRNIDKNKKRKNTQIRCNNNNSLSLLSEDSVFNISKHISTSNNDSSSNKQNRIKHSTSNSKEKSKSNVDLTYSDDEVISNRKKCDKMIKKTLIRNRTIINNNTNNFIAFYKEMNMKLFGIYK